MKAQIITINDYFNYGNKLQNYAMVQLLSSYGIEAYTATIVPAASAKYGRYLGNIRNSLVAKKRSAMEIVKGRGEGARKVRNFIDFEREYINKGIRLYPEHDASCPDSDLVIIGSDQVWNYNWVNEGELTLRLGLFATTNQVLAYAASIGIDEIPDNLKPLFRHAWQRMKYISVREDRAAELIREIADKDSCVVLDPTLMIAKKHWEEVFRNSNNEGERYVLTYFLGEPTVSQMEIINNHAKKYKLKVRMLNSLKDMESFSAGPKEFVELISKADYIFTDSYHACCFALIFNRPFKVFNRTGFSGSVNMNSRMRTLFRLFNLEDVMGDEETPLYFDWDKLNKKLDKHKQKSREWLDEAVMATISSISG